MAHHRLTVIGRVVGEVKHRSFDNGGAVAKFGVPIDFSRRKKNPQTGEWEGESFIIDVDVWNRDNYKIADWVRDRLKKGSHVYIEGRLKPNEYTDKNGVKVFKPVLVADVIEFLDPRQDGEFGGTGGGSEMEAPRQQRVATASPAGRPSQGGNYRSAPSSYDDDSGSSRGTPPNEEDIPF